MSNLIEISSGIPDDIFVEEVFRRLKLHEGKNWIFTNSGIQVFLASPTKEMIDINDIAHALSLLCRFNGQCNRFYCVGEHSALVADEVFRKTGDVLLAKSALFHDATEAYLGDVTGPLKDMLLVYEILEHRFEGVIKERFDLEYAFNHHEIKLADYEVFFTECDHLFDFKYEPWEREGRAANVKIECHSPQRAKQRFLETANRLGISA